MVVLKVAQSLLTIFGHTAGQILQFVNHLDVDIQIANSEKHGIVLFFGFLLDLLVGHNI